MSPSPKADDAIRLTDGRMLAYTEWGAADGTPVLIIHGTPGSRLERHSPAEAYDRLGGRFIGVDRPGMGLSDPLPRRTILDWPDDVVELADALRLGRFAIMGYSGGAPYAAACAYRIPERLLNVGLVSGSAAKPEPAGREATEEYAADADTSWAETCRRDPGAFIDAVFGSDGSAPESDRRIYQRPEVRDWLVNDLVEAFRQGTDGPAYDNFLLDGAWGFDPATIAAPVWLWHGELDANVPVDEARSLAKSIPHCRSVFYPGEGHLLIFEREEDILRTLVAAT